MKEVKVRLYKFDELSEDVQKSLIEKERNHLAEMAMDVNSYDRQNTLKVFEDIFGVTVKYEVDYCGHWSRVEFDDDAIFSGYNDEGWFEITADEVSGKLLLRYLDSKFPYLHDHKTFWGKSKIDENGKCIWKERRSKILWYDCCPLTGVCYDEEILDPIREYLRKPDKSLTLQDLMEKCVSNFILAWYKEFEYCYDNEAFLKDEFENRHWDDLFFENGEKFTGIYEEVA